VKVDYNENKNKRKTKKNLIKSGQDKAGSCVKPGRRQARKGRSGQRHRSSFMLNYRLRDMCESITLQELRAAEERAKDQVILIVVLL
jgi:hypothetical protein